ncbi:hypothetical protein [Sphingomonas endolithica]|uniref:hypothetical protein n=1 Tax=Sphingomonas endolithica TaxID=2972485 RepID=UPI0021AFAEF7|nr:hypothetical protein [Sphingomonas sp. ZFBP2030]
MKMLLPVFIALTACNFGETYSGDKPGTDSVHISMAERQTKREGAGRPPKSGRTLPANYIKAFMCEFDENPVAEANRFHKTSGGRAERAGDLTLLRSLGFKRESRDGDLESVGGKVAAPPGLAILGLPVRFLEINGMIGDTNALYVTTFADGVTVGQVVQAARLEMNRAFYTKYKIRHYNRRVDKNPHINTYLDDRGSSKAMLSCKIQSTPD